MLIAGMMNWSCIGSKVNYNRIRYQRIILIRLDKLMIEGSYHSFWGIHQIGSKQDPGTWSSSMTGLARSSKVDTRDHICLSSARCRSQNYTFFMMLCPLYFLLISYRHDQGLDDVIICRPIFIAVVSVTSQASSLCDLRLAWISVSHSLHHRKWSYRSTSIFISTLLVAWTFFDLLWFFTPTYYFGRLSFSFRF